MPSCQSSPAQQQVQGTQMLTWMTKGDPPHLPCLPPLDAPSLRPPHEQVQGPTLHSFSDRDWMSLIQISCICQMVGGSFETFLACLNAALQGQHWEREREAEGRRRSVKHSPRAGSLQQHSHRY